MKNYANLNVWQKAMSLVLSSYELSEGFPSSELHTLVTQVRNTAVSIPAYIAEGDSRQGARQYKYFLEVALGACFELETQLMVAEYLNYPKDKDLLKKLKSDIDVEQKLLMTYIQKIEGNEGGDNQK